MRNVKTREGMEYWDKICSLRHYGFLHSPDGKRVVKTEGIGNWIDKFEAQEIVDQAQDEINQYRAERDALQQLLNQRDEQVESLKMRPQGEPVARHPDAIIEGVMTSVGISHAIYASTVSLKHGEQVKLYAEQPAPVAVVLPKRRTFDPLDFVEKRASADGWNACLDELKRLNPSLQSLPLQSQPL
ncbi:hypothetical protein [Pseudomonas pergaminensis]|uniref:hypothetical protein n=1 Tax=Pseudomonas pergaminensis TaxID=2853159 RepID=UPI0034D4C3D3